MKNVKRLTDIDYRYRHINKATDDFFGDETPGIFYRFASKLYWAWRALRRLYLRTVSRLLKNRRNRLEIARQKADWDIYP